MATLEEFKSSARAELQELRDGEGIFKQVNNQRLEITDDDFEQMILDKANYEFDQQENGYKTARQESYPSVVEFMEAYTEKEIGGDSTKWDAYVVKYNQVRTDNPKP
nr:hypothetical protein [uncultured Mediterranean phage uvMED]